MTPKPSFESLPYKPFSVDGNLELMQFFQTTSSLHTKYFNTDNTKTFVNNNISSKLTLSSLYRYEDYAKKFCFEVQF